MSLARPLSARSSCISFFDIDILDVIPTLPAVREQRVVLIAPAKYPHRTRAFFAAIAPASSALEGLLWWRRSQASRYHHHRSHDVG
jgi:hypothetical protein